MTLNHGMLRWYLQDSVHELPCSSYAFLWRSAITDLPP